ncbi:PEP-utilizing enzyme [Neopusillimonas aromaticivorans]|nr:PEP-utilizing enzyme [Neopusillimonas aromaticivorans]WJJ93823.1 PEP-utilizing enzyme [Neopusillimonas aromaticivorans]
MSHAAIVCREYGMPAVVSTGFATAQLKTGQRIRIDGYKGTVEQLAA